MMSPYYRNLREKVGQGLLLVPSVAAVIHNSEGQLLLQEKTSEPWSLPAGAIEPGETPEEAVCREVLEETGLVVEPAEMLGVFSGLEYRYCYPNGDEVEYVVVLYQCHVLTDRGSVTDSETKSLRYVSKENMPLLALPYPIDVLFVY